MIAALGAQLALAGKPASPLGFSADSTLPVTVVYQGPAEVRI